MQQRVEILKALANDAKYLILDEPTAVLTPQETDQLMAVMRSLRDEGKAIVFITHKLREVREIADKITVIRHGKVVGTAKPADSESDLAELMVGRAVQLVVDKKPAATTAEPRLVMHGVWVARPNGTLAVEDLDLEVFGGEIVCIAGVQGNGQTELSEALLGITPVFKGSIHLDDNPLTGLSPREIIDAGLGFVPEDRKQDGCVSTFTVAENLILNHYDEHPYARGIALNLAKGEAERRTPRRRVRYPYAFDRGAGFIAVGRQPAKGRVGAGALPAAGAHGRLPAHSRARRRCHRVRPQAAGRGARPRHGRGDRLD